MEEYSREPCPYRIGDDVGSAFAMGLIGGSFFQSVIGFRNAAKGQKLKGALREVRLRAPLTGVQFAAWGGMFSTIDCGMVALRKKEDPLNSIVSGTLTGGILAVRSGPRTMAVSAVLGGVILAMIEGVGLISTRFLSTVHDPTQQPELEDPRNLPSKPSQVEDVGHNKDTAPFGLPTLSL
uniref:Mitochondrial import inner membrane translocase subunit TIM17 n=1 Tax=Steinernema glaseri TaxID=37863 RepID=A0A1I7ZMP8_9BILA